jgi:hypothetical protein
LATASDTFAEAYKLLQQAELVVILGFGFNRTNLERLKLDLVPAGAEIVASAFEMKPRECQRARDFAVRPITFGGPTDDNCAFLGNYVTLK